MDYIIFKNDGSILTQNLTNYIQQGNTGVNQILIAKADILAPTNLTCLGYCTLPDGTNNEMSGVWGGTVEYEGDTYTGWTFTLTSAQTTLNGALVISFVIQNTLNNNIVLTYPVGFVVNKTGYKPDADSGITVEQVNQFLVQLHNYQEKFSEFNVRGYSTENGATADASNFGDNQIFLVKNSGGSITAKIKTNNVVYTLPFAVAFSEITGDATSNTSLNTQLNAKEIKANKKNNFSSGNLSNDYYASTQAIYDFVNSSINQSVAFFKGNYQTRAALLAVAWQDTNPSGANYVSNNDYAIVNADETHDNETWRYVYSTTTHSWSALYKVNNAPFTQAQNEAINSGITSDKVATYDGYASGKQDKLTAGQNITIDENNVISATGGGGSGDVADVRVKNVSIVNETTKIANIDLQETINNTSTHFQVASAKAIYDLSEVIRAIAEGKCKSVILSYDDVVVPLNYSTYKKPNGEGFESQEDLEDYLTISAESEIYRECANDKFNSQDAQIKMFGSPYYILIDDETGNYKVIYFCENLHSYFKKGDVFIVVETEIPDRWFTADSDNSFYAYESKVDLSNYYAKDASLIPTTSSTYDLGSSSAKWKDIHLSNTINIGLNKIEGDPYGALKFGTEYGYLNIFKGSIIPGYNDEYSLGIDSNKFKDGKFTHVVSASNTHIGYSVNAGNNGCIGKSLNADGSIVPSIILQEYSAWFYGIRGISDGGSDLGYSGTRWKDLYMSGSIKDGTNTVSITDLANLIAYAKQQGWIS